MNSITSNEFTVKDTFCFAKEIVVGSLDVDSLFRNISLDETIDICSSQQDVIEGISKEGFLIFFPLATKQFSTRFYINKRLELQLVLI